MFTRTLRKPLKGIRSFGHYHEPTFVKERINAVLNTWFGSLDRDMPPSEEFSKKWFQPNPEFDEYIRENHTNDLLNIKKFRAQNWVSHDHGILASILIGDQFSRMIYRKKDKAFDLDPLCLMLSLQECKLTLN